MKSTVNISGTNGRGLEELKKRLRLGEHRVLVGVPDGPVEADGESTAQVAAWNEFGTLTSPERPFLRTGVRRAMPQVRRLATNDLRAVARGDATLHFALDRVGELAVSVVKDEILHGDTAPNAPSTIAKKGSSLPRVDTGHMLNSITHVVESP